MSLAEHTHTARNWKTQRTRREKNWYIQKVNFAVQRKRAVMNKMVWQYSSHTIHLRRVLTNVNKTHFIEREQRQGIIISGKLNTESPCECVCVCVRRAGPKSQTYSYCHHQMDIIFHAALHAWIKTTFNVSSVCFYMWHAGLLDRHFESFRELER